MASSAAAARPRPTIAPAGYRTRVAQPTLPARARPSAPIRSQAHASARTSCSGVASIPPDLFHAHAGLCAGTRGNEEDARPLARGGEHHALGDAELHLARREVG